MSVSETKLLPPSDALLTETWRRPPGLLGWFRATDHKSIGLRFIVTAFVFFVLGGIEALLMRTQLAQAEAGFLSPEAYNQIFTMHGTTMMFFFAVPILEGFGLFLVPLMIGARETAFPRMNAFAYYSYLIAGIAIYWSLLTGVPPDAGWFSYPTLTLKEYSPSVGIDFWALSITLLEFSALTIAITLIVTILKHRAPGMTIARMPLFVWSMLVFGFMIVFAMPTLLLATILLELDRAVGTHFFNPAEGGDPVLWQHLFWWFAHPEVYIMFIPGVGMIASVLPAFTRRSVVGYNFVALSLVATAFISFSVWAHHMFTTGLPRVSLGFFSAATLAVAIPSGVQIFAWLATVWSSPRLVYRTPFLFAIGFVVTFVLGGISGVTLSSVPFDRQVHDTHYVVAHFHYVLLGGMVFPMLAGLFYWFPKFTGRMLSERAGKGTFWLTIIGLNLAFLPMHLSGFWGMPRRVYTYPAGLGLEIPNLISTIGAFTFGMGIVLFLVNVAWSLRHGRIAGEDPWGSDSLEWATGSPPPPYNFRVIPSVRSRNPLWAQPELAPAGAGFGDGEHAEPRTVVALREDRRETIITGMLDGRPVARNIVAGPSILPLLAAISAGIAIIGAVASLYLVPIGMALGFIAVAIWHWPERLGGPIPVVQSVPPATSDDVGASTGIRPVEEDELPVLHSGPTSPVWWAMILFILIELVFFAAIMTAYFYLRGMEAEWPPGKTSPPDLGLPIAYSLVLLLSSVAMYWGDSGIREGKQRQLVYAQATAIGLAILFLVLKGIEYRFFISYTWYTHAYGSLSWTISGFHASHVASVVLKAAVVLALAMRGYFNEERFLGVEINGIYWHFVVLIWLPLFFVLYIAPRII